MFSMRLPLNRIHFKSFAANGKARLILIYDAVGHIKARFEEVIPLSL